MELSHLWFFIVGFLLIGYFVLDGFDFGVGMSLPFLGKDNVDRRVLINTIGPVWDLNETWLIVAGACLFAAFPEWYATMFSGFYLALLLILVALILRGVSFEYRHQGKGVRWTNWFDRFIVIGSVLPPLLWGTAFANLIQGVPLEKMDNGGWLYTGDLFTLLNPYGLLGGLTVMLLCFVHGLGFVALKTEGELRERAQALATKVGLATILAAATFLVWTIVQHWNSDTIGFIIFFAALAAVALIGAWLGNLKRNDRLTFWLHVVTITAALGAIFFALYPNVMISSIDPAVNSMSISGAASSQKTLELMTWVVVFTLPVVLAYQSWTFWVFRRRITRADIPTAAPAVAS